MLNLDWGLLQLQYEMFGSSFEDLAQEYDTTPRMIEYAAEQRGWKINQLAKATQDWQGITDLEQANDDLLEEVNSRMKIMRTIKSSALAPRYIALETAILGKALELLQNISPEDPGAATKIKMMTDVMKSLQTAGGGSDEVPQQPATKVLIVNKVGVTPASLGESTTVVIGDGQASRPGQDGGQLTAPVVNSGHAAAPCLP